MVWASQATSRCQGDTGTSEFVGSDGRTTAQVTWENVPAAPAGARGQRDAPGWQGTSEQWAPVGAGRGGEGRARSPCAATAQLPGGARHQRGGRGLRAGLRHPTSGAPRRPGPPLAPATGALAQHSARWLPGPCSPGGATRLGSTWGWLPGSRGRSTPHKAGSRRRMAPLPTSRPSVRAVPKPSCLIEYNTPPGTGVREPGRRAPPRPAVRLGTAGSWTGRGPAALLLGWPADASAASETVAWLRAVGGLFRTQHSAEADSRATSREERRLSGLGVPP